LTSDRITPEKQADARCCGSAANCELIERDAAGGPKLEPALVVEHDDGMTVGAGDDSIAHVYADAGRRSDRRTAAALNLHRTVHRQERSRGGLR